MGEGSFAAPRTPIFDLPSPNFQLLSPNSQLLTLYACASVHLDFVVPVVPGGRMVLLAPARKHADEAIRAPKSRRSAGCRPRLEVSAPGGAPPAPRIIGSLQDAAH